VAGEPELRGPTEIKPLPALPATKTNTELLIEGFKGLLAIKDDADLRAKLENIIKELEKEKY